MLAIICALFGAAAIFISDFMIIPLAAVYAALLWFDQKNKLWAALLPLVILALSVLGGIATVFFGSLRLLRGSDRLFYV